MSQSFRGSKKHGYGDFSPEPAENMEEMLKQNPRDVFLEGIADYVKDHLWNNYHKRYRNNFSTNKSQEKAIKKAEEILDGEKKTDLPPEIDFSEREHKKIIKAAEQSGYLQNFHLDEPWHIKPFLEGKFLSFPYQHDYAILYTGVNKEIFFKKEFTSKDLNNVKSVIPRRYILGRVEEDQKFIDMKELGSRDEANWLGFPGNAAYFAERAEEDYKSGGAVLEVLVPTDQLETILASKRNRKRDTGDPHQTVHVSNLEELKRELTEDRFETPLQAFHHYCKISREADPHDYVPDAEIVHFAVQHEIPFKNILGVWDYEFVKKPVYESLGSYIKTLKSREKEKLPKGIEEDEIKKEIEKELKHLKRFRKLVKDLLKSLLIVKTDIKNREKPDRSFNSDLFQSHISNYQENLRKLKNFIDQEFDAEIKFETLKSEQTLEELEKSRKLLVKLEEKIQDIIQEEKRKVIDNNWTLEDFKQEKKYEEKINKQILKEISKLYSLRN
jgi:hypothetical protein